ncbi:thioester-containing protein 1 allele S3-like [Haematobia irritans]|uniref:thioester-containing protein 1 allele S3-like n=1 Tax=Haematobia irritans TaxID=7368 RepID=UPI003F50BAF8
MRYLILYLAFIANCVIIISGESYYSLAAPGIIKSNRKYMVVLSLHEAKESAKFHVKIQGPSYHLQTVAYLEPYETRAIIFLPPKLAEGPHKLIVEGLSGLIFRNESKIIADAGVGPKIYIQTDKAVFKPGDEVQFRVVILDEHTRPLEVAEPIRIDIMDGKSNRVKQFKDIKLHKGVYKNKFQLSEYPVMGDWTILVSISGKYDYSQSKIIKVQKYILPKFSVYIKIPPEGCLRSNCHFKAAIYGKYTFEKYVEGDLIIRIIAQLPHNKEKVIEEKQLYTNGLQALEFSFDVDELLSAYGLYVQANLTEKHTGLTHSDQQYLYINNEPYKIYVDDNAIEFRNSIPYSLKARVTHWNGLPLRNAQSPLIMKHGSKEYTASLDKNGEATFKFDHDKNHNHYFRYENSTYTFYNVFSDKTLGEKKTESYFTLNIKGDRVRMGTDIEVEVKSTVDMPYLIYTIMAHSNIIHADRIKLPPNSKNYTILITPSIEMVPKSFVYVYYIENGILRYEELEIRLPLEFENKVTVGGPKQVAPGQNVTLAINAQPQSLVGILAVDLGVFLLDNSYDLKKNEILHSLENDFSRLPMPTTVYPGVLSGIITLTNAHYKFVPLNNMMFVSPKSWNALRFRRKFPETWIFENYEVTNQTTQLSLEIPDTITTWRITAFSINEKSGFGIVDGPTDITTIQPFFISLNLPYSVKRGEIVTISILVNNYQDQSVNTEVKLYNENHQFYFMESNIFDSEKGFDDQERIKRIDLPAQTVTSTSFLINPKEVGDITLRITATNGVSSDAILQKLRVEPEGIPTRRNKALLMSVQPSQMFNVTFPLKIPQNIVPESEFITLSVGGDNMVPTIKNLNELVLAPTGCGEQNMVNFAPNILVLEYLKATGQYFKQRALVKKAKKFIENGYQQQLSYRHSNGAYSVFGQRTDKEASTWLTAYVIRFFMRATKYLNIEAHILESGLEYLSKAQLNDGSFPYTGYLFYPAQQNRFGHTAFVLMTFLEEKKYSQKYQTTIDNALNFLNNHLDKIDDLYALSIISVAMRTANHPNAAKIMKKLNERQQSSADHIWWTQGDNNRVKDVEITAYALLANLQDNSGDANVAQNIVKWLTEQRNERGGFKTTHDTVVGLQALVQYSMKYNSVDNLNVKVQYSAKNKEDKVLKTGAMNVDANNVLVLQTEEFPQLTRSIDIEATGMGNALLQLAYHYHTITVDNFKNFLIQPKPKKLNANEMHLEICFSYIQNASLPMVSATNMIIMEVNLPSGYTSPEEYNNDLLDNELIERIESKNFETTVVVYFAKVLSDNNNCLQILADKVHDVVNRKAASIVVYDYYDINRHDTAFYTI